MMKTTFAAAICAGLLALSAAPATASSINFHVQVNTAPLVGSASAPFALDFQLIGGNPLGNTATISNFTFGGGAATTAPTPPNYTGLAAGSLTGTVTLGDDPANFFNEFFQGFTPGSTLGFDVLLTANVNTPTADGFSFAILDSALANIQTTNPDDVLLLVSIGSPNLGMSDVQLFRGAGAFSAVTVTASPIPEPASVLLVGVGLVGVAVRRRRRRITA